MENFLEHEADIVRARDGAPFLFLAADRGEDLFPAFIEQRVDFLAVLFRDPAAKAFLDLGADIVLAVREVLPDLLPLRVVAFLEEFLEEAHLELLDAGADDDHAVLPQVKEEEDDEEDGEKADREEKDPYRSGEGEGGFLDELADEAIGPRVVGKENPSRFIAFNDASGSEFPAPPMVEYRARKERFADARHAGDGAEGRAIGARDEGEPVAQANEIQPDEILHGRARRNVKNRGAAEG